MSTTFKSTTQNNLTPEPSHLSVVPLSEVLAVAGIYGMEGCGVNSADPLYKAYMNGFVGALHECYANHLPLALSPDDIWTVIMQGFAIHVTENAEALRGRFVDHEGKKTLLVELPGYVKGGTNNPWEEGLAAFSAAIRENIGEKTHDLVVGNFSTTGAVERAASEIVLMGAMSKYFNYMGRTMCGIPEITLLGETSDWESIRTRAAALGEYDLGWWTETLLPVLDQFVAASKGDVDIRFWEGIYKVKNESGGPFIGGWVNTLFPYLNGWHYNYETKESAVGVFRNDFLTGSGSGRRAPTTDLFPMGMTRVPWKWDYYSTIIDMEFWGGFVGYTRNPQTNLVRPAISWAVTDPAIAAKEIAARESARKSARRY
jgi:hypothetical protein